MSRFLRLARDYGPLLMSLATLAWIATLSLGFTWASPQGRLQRLERGLAQGDTVRLAIQELLTELRYQVATQARYLCLTDAENATLAGLPCQTLSGRPVILQGHRRPSDGRTREEP
jgi:hypothetical protein